MSLLKEYYAKQDRLEALQKEIDALESDENFKDEMEFKTKLEELMASHEKGPQEVIKILSPEDSQQEKSSGQQDGRRAKRKLKTFKNPHTGEIIETRGGNHKGLKQWKAEHGEETVKQWEVG